MIPRRIFAVIPAAGHSRRMGQPKLLLPLGGETVIAHFLWALAVPEIAETVIVIRRDDALLKEAVEQISSRSDAKVTVIQPEIDPPEMRASVAHALVHLARSQNPGATDAWLLSPADHPALDRDLIVSLARRWQTVQEPVLTPVHAGRRGHPVLLSWELAEKIDSIPQGEGLNWLVRASPVAEFSVACPGVFADLDTPADYAEFLRQWENSASRRVP